MYHTHWTTRVGIKSASLMGNVNAFYPIEKYLQRGSSKRQYVSPIESAPTRCRVAVRRSNRNPPWTLRLTAPRGVAFSPQCLLPRQRADTLLPKNCRTNCADYGLGMAGGEFPACACWGDSRTV